MSLNLLTDFPDKLSPMLVKELRQGMRARSFTVLFLVFQGLLAFILLSAGSSFNSDGAGVFASGVIFLMFSIAVLVIQPMRGVNALSSEITGNTIEMMVLTRLSAWRIVFGKWIAIVSQSALILTTIIPYLILRYFFGGMVLLGELVFLGLIFLTSMALTAVMVGFSATSAKLVRGLPVLGIVFVANVGPPMLRRGGGSGMNMSFFTLATTEAQLVVTAYLCFITYVGWCALSHGTSSIAPVSENHSSIRRLIALGLTLIGLAIGFHPNVDPRFLTVVFGIILTPAILIALTEPAILLPPICKPFLKRGLPGRLASTFLLPGWPAGAIFTALIVGLSIAGVVIATYTKTTPRYDEELAIIALSLLGTILLPALLSAVFSKQESKRFTNFLLFLLVSILLAVGPMILTSLSKRDAYLWFFAWNPPVAMSMLHSPFEQTTVLATIAMVDGTLMGALLIAAAAGMVRYRKIMNESEPGNASTTAAATPIPVSES